MSRKFANKDDYFMQQALEQAALAGQSDEVPIGAVVINADGVIIGTGYNSVEADHTQTAHAEIKALAQAGAYQQGWRLHGCWLYVTLEPCSMCMHALLHSRVDGVVYGASSPLFGYHLDNALALQLYKKHEFEVVAGVGAQQAQALLKQFFKRKREQSNERSDKF